MRIGLSVLSIVYLIFFPCSSSCQVIDDSYAKIKNINFFILNDELNITYDITNALPKEKFLVTARIFSDSGKIINATSLRGDIGENISAGYWASAFLPVEIFGKSDKNRSNKFTRKKIFWDIAKDMDSLNNKIYVEIEATQINPAYISPTSKSKALVLSTVYPGWGSSRTSLQTSHILRGMAAYLCVGGAIYYSNLSKDSYSGYLVANTTSESDLLFRNTENQFRTSRIFLFSAGAIWLLDYLDIIKSENLSEKTGYKSQLTFFRGGSGSTNFYPGLSLLYNF